MRWPARSDNGFRPATTTEPARPPRMPASRGEPLTAATGRGGPSPPARPSDIPRASLATVLRRSRTEFRKDNLTTLAAALTYYGVLAVVPGLLVIFMVLGLAGRDVTGRVASQVDRVAPGSAGQFVHTLLSEAQAHRTGSGVTAAVGAAIVLWSASSYVNGFRQASNVIYGIGEGRPIWKTVPLRIGITAFVVVLLVACALIVVVSGSVADEVGRALGAGHVVVTVWNIAKWPVLLVLITVLLAVMFWASPNAQQGGIRWVSPGGLVATVLWLALSGLFALYVVAFASYNRTYGPLAGIVIFLIWLWLSNLALLLGAEVNAELVHAKAVAEGLPEEVRPFVEPRDTRKLDDEQRREVERAHARRPR